MKDGKDLASHIFDLGVAMNRVAANLNEAPDLFAIPAWSVEPAADHNGLRAAVVRIVLHDDEMEALLAYVKRAGLRPEGVVAHAVGAYIKRVALADGDDEPEEPRPVEFDDRLAGSLENNRVGKR